MITEHLLCSRIVLSPLVVLKHLLLTLSFEMETTFMSILLIKSRRPREVKYTAAKWKSQDLDNLHSGVLLGQLLYQNNHFF